MGLRARGERSPSVLQHKSLAYPIGSDHRLNSVVRLLHGECLRESDLLLVSPHLRDN